MRRTNIPILVSGCVSFGYLFALAFFSAFAGWPRIVSIYHACASVAAFAAIDWDKRQARLGRRRVPEMTLHLMELFGGWPGSLFGQWCFRHKTRKLKYQIVFWLAMAAHLAIQVAVALVVGGSSHQPQYYGHPF